MDAVWTEGTISAAVAVGRVFAESAELVFVSIQPAAKARTRVMRARIRIVRFRIGTPLDTSDSTLKNILIGKILSSQYFRALQGNEHFPPPIDALQ
jgi:hypothetical protein